MLHESPGGSSIAATPVPVRFFQWISLYNSLRSQGCLVTRSIPCPLFPLVPQIPVSSSSPCMWPCVPQPLGFWCHRCHRGSKGLQPLAGTASLETSLEFWAHSSPALGNVLQDHRQPELWLQTGSYSMGQSSALPASQLRDLGRLLFSFCWWASPVEPPFMSPVNPPFCHHWFCTDYDSETRKGSLLCQQCSSAQCPWHPARYQVLYSVFVWGHWPCLQTFWLGQLVGCYWHLVGGSRGCCLTSYNTQDKKLLVQMLSALWLETLLQGQFYASPFTTREIEALSS